MIISFYENEIELSDDSPIVKDKAYIVDGRIHIASINTTVNTLKKAFKISVIRDCDLDRRMRSREVPTPQSKKQRRIKKPQYSHLSTSRNQEIFTKVKNHLLQQNRKAEDEIGSLFYAPKGLKSAVGVLIPAELYSPSIEGAEVRTVLMKVKANMEFLLNPPEQKLYEILKKLNLDNDLIKDLQITHDYYEPKHWSVQLAKVAERYGLKY